MVAEIDTKLSLALLGNPNAGKTSLFNTLTGLNQKVGNFPGVTIDKKSGSCASSKGKKCTVVDLPGAYSIYPRSKDEKVVFDYLSNKKNKTDLLVFVADASNLKRNLLFFSQISDLNIPVILVLTMMDIVEDKSIEIDIKALEKELSVPVFTFDGRDGKGVEELKKSFDSVRNTKRKSFFEVNEFCDNLIESIKKGCAVSSDYLAYQLAQQSSTVSGLSNAQKVEIERLKEKYQFKGKSIQAKEILSRYQKITELIQKVSSFPKVQKKKNLTFYLDKVLTHKIFGYLSFIVLLLILFQSIFQWATIPMEWIETFFAQSSAFVAQNLPDNLLSRVFSEAIIPGLGGIVIFIPQIALLFFGIAILEESGYMARVVFLMDRIMRTFGLNGKSVIPLVSGSACAIPAIMAARNIENSKERLITILVTPLMSCSARLPVYTILIALIVPDLKLFGFVQAKGLLLLGLYLLGFFAALFVAMLLTVFLKNEEKSYLVMELPEYRMPRWKNIITTVFEKSKSFVFGAGKVIIVVSVVLWALASFGPNDNFYKAEEIIAQNKNLNPDSKDFQDKVDNYKLEHSFVGILGKSIEPLVEPLGYDWKMGIALITSFAAREVFVGTMATLYKIGSSSEPETIKDRMAAQINPITGKPVYSIAVASSLLIFYAFAMQCMSTLAIVRRETKSWKWPMVQLGYLSVLAYASAFLVYRLLL